MAKLIRDIGSESALLQCGFRVGYFSRQDIERWADEQIERADQPSMDLIELATLRGKHDWDVVSLLSRVSSEIGPGTRTELTIGLIGRLYRADRASLESSVRALFTLVLDGDRQLSVQERGEIYYLDDAYDLAMSGAYGSVKEVKSHFLAFTEPYAAIVGDWESLMLRSENA